jgi:putative ABC transport system permease protein
MDVIRQSLRALLGQRGFTAVAILTLAFGIAVNVALFGMISAFFFQPLPIPNPDRLVIVMQRSDLVNVPYGHAYADYRDYREASTTLRDMAAYMPTPVHLAVRGQAPERTWIEVVSPNYFTLAGVAPAFGTFPRPGADEAAGAPPSVVLSHAYWQRRFGGNPSTVGQAITLNGRPFTVIGIAPEHFTGLSWAMAVSAFVPAGAVTALLENGAAMIERRDVPAFRLMGRLAPGATMADARAEFSLLAERLASAYPAEHKGGIRIELIPEMRSRPDPAIAGFLPIFAALFAAMAGLVLLIACANVANLVLARAIVRQRDLVIRSALGASRRHLVRLQVTESLILAAAAGVLGLLLAQWAGQALAGFTPTGDIPIRTDQPLDWRLYAFAVLVSATAGVLTGLWPALKATRFDLVGSLKDGTSGAGTSRHRLRSLLVVGQVTMSLVVLASAGLFLESLRQMHKLDVGLRAEGLLMASVDLGLQGYDDARGRRFLEDLVTRVEALPGVQAASVAAHIPFDYGITFADVALDQDIPGTKDGVLSSAFNVVSAGYFDAAGTLLVRGRGFNRGDGVSSRRVGIVNETMARQLWPERDAIGQRFRRGSKGPWIEVVGVARDGKYMMLAEPTRPYFYLPMEQDYRSPATLIVRSASEPLSLAAPVQRVLNELDPDLPVFNVRTMEQHLRDSVFAFLPLRMAVTMATAQGAVGLLLAVIGLYAVVSYTVTRRTREIGVRMALGAGPGDVLRLVVRDGMRLSMIGVGVGAVMALGIGVGLSHVLYGLPRVNVTVLLAVTTLLLVVSAVACYVPARRATRVDPMIALRCE